MKIIRKVKKELLNDNKRGSSGLKKIQIQLMANSNNQGNGNEMIKESTKAAFGDGFYDDTHLYKKILYKPEAVERIVEYVKDLS